MPFASDKQRRFLWSQKPEVAKKFAEHHADGGVAGGKMFNNKGLKKLTQKDRYGNTMTYEFEAPVKPLDPTALMKAQMELEQPEVDVDIFGMEGFAGGGMPPKYDHPGEPKGTDTVPAWLTPGEFVMNAEATEMYKPMIEQMNNHGRAMQQAQGGPIPRYHAHGGLTMHRMPGGIPMDGAYHADGGLIDKILTHEGGFVDDPDDRGGRTNFGITQKTWGDRGDVADLTRDQAKEFYESEYDRFGVDRFPEELRPQIFDMIVNHGYGNTVGILQGLGGVEQDRKVGPGTLGALEGKTADDLADARIGFFDEIIANDPSQAKFEKGWKKRAESWRPQHKQTGGPISSTWQPPVPPSAIPDLPVEEEVIEEEIVPVPRGRMKGRGPQQGEWEAPPVDPRARAQAQRERTPEQMVPEPDLIGGRMGRAEELAEEAEIARSDEFLDDADVETIDIPEEKQQEELDAIITEPAGKTDGPGNKQKGPQVKNSEVEAVGKEAAEAEPGAVDRVKKAFSGAFGKLFDDEQLATAAIMYLGSRAMGYSHAGSLRWSTKNYLAGLQQKDKRAYELAKSGKYTPASVEEYKKTGDISKLKVPPKSRAGTGDFKTMIGPNGKAQRVQKYKVGEGQYVWATGDGQAVDQRWRDDRPDLRKGTPEYKSRINTARKEAHGAFEEIYKAEGTSTGDHGQNIYHTKITPHQASRDFIAWAEDNGLDPQSPEALEIMGNAYRTAIQQGKDAGDVKVQATKLRPYLEAQYIRETTGVPEMFMRNREAVDAGKERPKYLRQDLMSSLNASVEAVAATKGAKPQEIYNFALKKWGELSEKQKKIYNKGADAGRTGFYDFMTEEILKAQ